MFQCERMLVKSLPFTCNLARRCFASGAETLMSCPLSYSQPPVGSGLLELRAYSLKPEGFTPYLRLCHSYHDTRKRIFPIVGMFTTETGGDVSTVYHLYHYEDLDQRDQCRAFAKKDAGWQAHTDLARQHMLKRESIILKEASSLYTAIGFSGASGFKSPPATTPPTQPVYELRTMTMKPGCQGVQQVFSTYEKSLPPKMANEKEGGMLVMVSQTDMGMLNRVIELWRYPSAQALLRSCDAARKVPEWQASKVHRWSATRTKSNCIAASSSPQVSQRSKFPRKLAGPLLEAAVNASTTHLSQLPPVVTVLLLKACAAAKHIPALQWQQQLYQIIICSPQGPAEGHPSRSIGVETTESADEAQHDGLRKTSSSSSNNGSDEVGQSRSSSSSSSSSSRFAPLQLISVLSSLADLGLQPPPAILQAVYGSITNSTIMREQETTLSAKYLLRFLKAVACFSGAGCKPSPAVLVSICQSSALLHSNLPHSVISGGSALEWLQVLEALPLAMSEGNLLPSLFVDRMIEPLLPAFSTMAVPLTNSQNSSPPSSNNNHTHHSSSSGNCRVRTPLLSLDSHLHLIGVMHTLCHIPSPTVAHRLIQAIHQQLLPTTELKCALATLTAISHLLDLETHTPLPQIHTPSQSAAGGALNPHLTTAHTTEESASARETAGREVAVVTSSTLSLSDFVVRPPQTATAGLKIPNNETTSSTSSATPGFSEASPILTPVASTHNPFPLPYLKSATNNSCQLDTTAEEGVPHPEVSPASSPSISCLSSRLYCHLTSTTLLPLVPRLTSQQLVSLVSATAAVQSRLYAISTLPHLESTLGPVWADAVQEALFLLLPTWRDSDDLVDLLRDLNRIQILPSESRLSKALVTALFSDGSIMLPGSASGSGSDFDPGSQKQTSSIILCLYMAACLDYSLESAVVRGACAILQPVILTLSPSSLVNTLWALARLGASPGAAWLQAAATALQLHLPALQSQQLSFSLAALQRMGARLPSKMVDECLAVMAAVMRTEATNPSHTCQQQTSIPASHSSTKQDASSNSDRNTPSSHTASAQQASSAANSVLGIPSKAAAIQSTPYLSVPSTSNASLPTPSAAPTAPASSAAAVVAASKITQSGSPTVRFPAVASPASCSSADVALMAVTVARLQHVAGYSWSEAVSEHMVAHMQGYSGAELTSVAWAFAKTHDQPSEEWVKSFFSASEAQMKTLAADNLATLLWAVAELELAPSEEWLAALISASRPQLGSFAPQSLVSVLDACAKLKFQPSSDWMCECLVVLQAYAPMLDLLAVCTVLSAMVEMGVRLTNLGWFAALCDTVEPKLGLSSVDQVLSMCQSLTTLGYLPGPGWHAALVASARASQQPLTAETLEQLLLCSAALQASLPDDLLQSFYSKSQQSLESGTMTGSRMASIAPCLANLDGPPPQDWLAVFAQCARSQLSSFTTLELNTLTKALNTLNGKQTTPLAPLANLLAYLKEWFIY